LERTAEAAGRDPATVRRSVGLYTLVGENERDLSERFRALQRWTPGGGLDGVTVDAYAADTLTGTGEDCVKRLARFAELGVEEMIMSAASLPFAVFDWEMLELVSEAVI